MKQFVIFCTIGLLLLIGIGSAISNDDLLQAFASQDALIQCIRGALVMILVSFLFIKPPRSIAFRAFLGITSVALISSVFTIMTHYYMGALDAVIFIEAGIIFAIEALEIPEKAKSLLRNPDLETA